MEIIEGDKETLKKCLVGYRKLSLLNGAYSENPEIANKAIKLTIFLICNRLNEEGCVPYRAFSQPKMKMRTLDSILRFRTKSGQATRKV